MKIDHFVLLVLSFGLMLGLILAAINMRSESKENHGLMKVAECERFTQDELDGKLDDGETEYLKFQWCAGYLGAYYGAKAAQ